MVAVFGKTLLSRLVHLSNKDVFESEDVVKSYSNTFSLQKPEETILNLLRSKLSGMKMLDIGVGGGRTTPYFAPLTEEYVGVDYSENMINMCRQRYPGSEKKLSFEVADARALSSLGNSYFDLVLFSFNGIDYLNHEDRLKALQEVHRVTTKGGYFCFSAHNLNSASKLCTFRLSKSPLKLLREGGRLVLMRLTNKNTWKALRSMGGKHHYLMFNNGAHNFRTITYYITPIEQTRQLTDSGFSNIKIYGLQDGREITSTLVLQSTTDEWLYYLCNNNE
jgi:ubiquinone/menaquinone biosynthesis C-methylase UbiE